MNKGSFKINPYKTITIICDEDLPSLEVVENICYNKKRSPLLTPTELEAMAISGILSAFNQYAQNCLELNLPKYLNNVHVVGANFIDKKNINSSSYGVCCSLTAYISRQNDLGYFIKAASHEIAHLFAASSVLWKIVKQKVTIYCLNSGLSDKLRFYGLNEAITEMLSHRVIDYALASDLISLDEEEIPSVKLVSYGKGVKLINCLLDRHANSDTEMRRQYVKDLFTAYLQGDIEKALEALGVFSDCERDAIKNMAPTKDDYVTTMSLFKF